LHRSPLLWVSLLQSSWVSGRTDWWITYLSIFSLLKKLSSYYCTGVHCDFLQKFLQYILVKFTPLLFSFTPLLLTRVHNIYTILTPLLPQPRCFTFLPFVFVFIFLCLLFLKKDISVCLR
jgi:hypothetical protein